MMIYDREFRDGEWTLDRALALFMDEGFRDGDLVSHDFLRMALDINEATSRRNPFVLLERMEALKALLLENHQIALQNVRGRGYRLVPPAEQSRFAAEEAARYMARGLKKADRLLEHTRTGELDDQQLKRHTDTAVRMAALRGMVGKGQRDVFALFDSRKRKAKEAAP